MSQNLVASSLKEARAVAVFILGGHCKSYQKHYWIATGVSTRLAIKVAIGVTMRVTVTIFVATRVVWRDWGSRHGMLSFV